MSSAENLTANWSDRQQFIARLREASGQAVEKCYQCGKCTAGCPIAPFMDLVPNRVMRLVQLGQEEELLRAQSIWLCAFCSTCSVRCPRQIEVARVMDALRIMAGQRGMEPPGRAKRVALFYRNFLASVEANGRLFEFGTMLGYNLRSGHPFQQLDAGLAMLRRGKLKFLPERPAGQKEIKKIFTRIRELEGKG
ncbi:MAG: 4Fe-4S dicluster domain-containing protein [Bacillota bacterium]|uniref:4Fe-4S dicluster domain-containing protein n=1 Tax=Desulfurispora thermophila TaxID=265470 RepID=UPI00037B7A3C|nr:4Fe-4S dicluster domain-containing protein [Desulfurispora thermophila]